MIEREWTCPAVGPWANRKPECTEKGTIPPLNRDNASLKGHPESVLSESDVLSQYAETVPESGNGVLNRTKPPQLVQDADETARNVENCPLPESGVLRDVGNVVERLEGAIRQIDSFVAALAGDGETGFRRLVEWEGLVAALNSAIHDLQVEAVSQERWADEYKAERDILQTTYEGCCKEYEKLEAENARLLALLNYSTDTMESGNDVLESLLAERDGLREALKPFAAMAESVSREDPDKVMSNTRIHPPLYVGDFLYAGTCLQALTGEQE